jgi:hypothetical protein
VRRLLPLLAVAGLALAACGGGSSASGGASPATSTQAGTGPDSLPAALRFTVAQIGGGTIDASAYAGRPVAFWFWAPT